MTDNSTIALLMALYLIGAVVAFVWGIVLPAIGLLYLIGYLK